MLKSNIKLLEKQVTGMKQDFASSPRKKSTTSQRSGFCQTDDIQFASSSDRGRRRSGWSQTDTNTPSWGSSGTQTSIMADDEYDELNSSVFSFTRSPKQKRRGRTPKKMRSKRGDVSLNDSSFVDASVSHTEMGTSPIRFDTSRRSVSFSPRRRSSPKKSPSRRSASKSPMRVTSHVKHQYLERDCSDDEHSRNISITVKVRHTSSEAPLANAEMYGSETVSHAGRPSPKNTVLRKVKKLEASDLDTSDIQDDKEARYSQFKVFE